MNSLTFNDWEHYSEMSQIGLWKIEMRNGETMRMYVNSVMQTLIGAPDNLSPEECSDFFKSHIHPDDIAVFKNYDRELRSGYAEVVYRYIHPKRGEMQIRCMGKKISESGNIVTIMGQHQEISDIVRLGNGLLRENLLRIKNKDLEAQKAITADYYKNLLDMESCGIIAYTVPDYNILHMNAEALRICGVDNISDAQNEFYNILSNVSYPDSTIIQKLKSLSPDNDIVDYECVIKAVSGQTTSILARTEAFITPSGKQSIVTTFIDISENKELKKEKNILAALSIDYTSVYYCNLDCDLVYTLKQENDDYVASYEKDILQDNYSFSYHIRHFYEHFVEKSSAPDFVEKMSAEYLKQYLSNNNRFAYCLKLHKNPSNCRFFEVQVVQVADTDNFCVVVGYRCIDDIVKEQEQQKYNLKLALTEANENKIKLEQRVTSLKNIHLALTSGAWNLMYNRNSELTEVNWSNTMRYMLGFSSTKDFPNTFETWTDKLHPDDKEYTLNEYALVLANTDGQKKFDVDCRLRAKDGCYHWFRATGYLSRRSDGSPQSFDGVFINMDEKHATSEKLHSALKEAQDARNELLLEHEIISAVSKLYFSVYRIDLVNDFYEEISSDKSIHRLTGHEGRAQQKMNELCNSIVSENYRDAVRNFFDLSTVVQRLSHTDTVEIEYFSTDGNWHQARLIEKKRDQQGNVIRLLYVTRIVSQEKRRELEKQRLEIAYQVAERANEAKTTFLLNMSHDIRTPMNAILGFSKLMGEKLNDPELKHYQEMIDESGKLLLSIINNVLDMARIESGKVELDENCSEIGNILDGVCKVFAAEAEKKNIVFTNNVQVEHPYIMCDITKLQEIFTNLISNSIKYTPNGGKITVITTELPCNKEGYANFQTIVKDTGIGISKEFLPHLFDSFTRERNTTIGKVLGTGLGMPIVKSLVDLMNGTIDIDSELGKGTQFTITISHKIASKKYYEAETVPDIPIDTNFSGKRTLLAEDNDLNAEIAIAMLERMGISVDRANDGIICVEKLENSIAGTYDFILMDIQMPNMDGYKATQEIRCLPDKQKANIPIIAMTANAFKEDKEKAFSIGMNGHITKPIDMENIKRTLALVIK